jgi:peptidoglycan/xylan/chitin deacetylase (PgdA/CDA1 family)
VGLDRRQFVLGLLGAGITFGVASCTSATKSSLGDPTGASGSGDATTFAGATSGASAAASTTAASVTTPPSTSPPSTSPATAPPPLGPAKYVSRGSTASARAAFTFHTEGTPTQVGHLLDMAKALEVPLTMFIVGKWLDENRDIGKRIADAGHDIGNHTYSHLSLPDQKRDVVASEISRCADLLRTVTGTGGMWFRPSGSNSTTTLINEEAGKAGYPIVLGFDTDPVDYEDPGSSVVRTRVVNGIKAGSIVSLHAQHQGTLDVFESMVAAVRAKGITLVRARDLVAV